MKPFLVTILLLGGVLAVLYPFQIVKTFGHLGWAEDKLGPGGSYGAWRLIGIGLIVLAVVVLRFF